jgi:DNA-directed RNA polymerase beta subunit
MNYYKDILRIGMQSTQSKHIIPTEKQSRPLFGSGIEKTLAYAISDDFAFKAKKSGVVKQIDTEKELMILSYDDGTEDVVDLSAVQAKNSNGGLTYKVHNKSL